MFKNVASQSIALFAFDMTTNQPKTGDAANMLLYLSKDWGLVTLITANLGVPTEMDATNAPGWYKIALSQAETNADTVLFSGKSSTANVSVVGALVYTDPANFTALAINASGLVALTPTEETAIADVLLNRDMSLGTDSGSPTVRTVRQALRAMRNKWTVAAGTYTVFKEDDVTSSWTSALTTTAGANPVTTSDPA